MDTEKQRDSVTQKDLEEIKTTLQYYDPDVLKQHPLNEKIYGSEEVDLELVSSIQANTQLEPIIINQDHVIISGHRRWLALKEVNKQIEEEAQRKEEKGEVEEKKLMAKCIVIRYANERDEEEAIIESNRQREKTTLQLYNEIKRLKVILAEKAEERKKLNLLHSIDVRDFRTSGETENESGRTRDKLTKAFNIKRDRIDQILKIGELYYTNNENAKIIMKQLDAREITLDAAIKKLKLMEIADSDEPGAAYAKNLEKQIDKKNITASKAEKMLEAHLKKETNEIPPITAEELRVGSYNVFIAYPPKLPAKDKEFTDTKNAVLFLMASAKNLIQTIELMESLGFRLKDIAVWQRSASGGTYFNGKIEFWLLGIKGHIENQKNNCPIIFETKQHIYNPDIDKIPDHVYAMVEQMFPNQKYLDLSLGKWPQVNHPDDMETNHSEAMKQNNEEGKTENSPDSNSLNNETKSIDRSMPETHNPDDQTATRKKDQSNDDWL